MLHEPTPQDEIRARKDGGTAPATVTVHVEHEQRVEKPATDEYAFEIAADLALLDATDAGYEAVAYVNVTEFVTRDTITDGLVYRYVWEFTAHK